MAYKVIILYRLYMPSYFLGTFTEYPYKKRNQTFTSGSFNLLCAGGKTGIRTLGTVTRSPHFECGPIDHSGIFPFVLRCKSNGFYDKLFFFCRFFYA